MPTHSYILHGTHNSMLKVHVLYSKSSDVNLLKLSKGCTGSKHLTVFHALYRLWRRLTCSYMQSVLPIALRDAIWVLNKLPAHTNVANKHAKSIACKMCVWKRVLRLIKTIYNTSKQAYMAAPSVSDVQCEWIICAGHKTHRFRANAWISNTWSVFRANPIKW